MLPVSGLLGCNSPGVSGGGVTHLDRLPPCCHVQDLVLKLWGCRMAIPLVENVSVVTYPVKLFPTPLTKLNNAHSE